MRVLGYVRVSTAEQSATGGGLQAQRAAIEQEAQYRGWQLVAIVEDAGFSAKDLKRPGIQSALTTLECGGADGLLVAKLDRLSRSMLDFTTLMARARREEWALVALDCAVDTTTPAGEAMANVLATFAQFERRLIGQRTKDALAVKRAQGVRLGRPRVVTADFQRRLAQERAAGATFASIAERLNAEGVPTAQGGRQWWPATVRGVLRRSDREALDGTLVACGSRRRGARGLDLGDRHSNR